MLVKYSSIVLLLLERKCPINSTRTWDHENRLARIGITAKPPFVHDKPVPCRPPSKSARIPAGLSASQMRSFVKFIHRLRAQPEAMKLEFINWKGGEEEVGRKVWRRWFRSTIRHRLHHTITKFLVQIGMHPVQLMYRTGNTSMMRAVPDVLSYTTIVGIDIFGPGVTYKGPDLTYCREKVYIYIENVIEVWWKRSYKAWNRVQYTDIPQLREGARYAIDCLATAQRALRMEDIKMTQEIVNEYDRMALWHPVESEVLEGFKSILEGIWYKVGKVTNRTVYPRAASLRLPCFRVGYSKDVSQSDLANEVEVEVAWNSFIEYFSDPKPVFEDRPEWNDEMLKGITGRG